MAIVRTMAAMMITTPRSGAIDWCDSGTCFIPLGYADPPGRVNVPG